MRVRHKVLRVQKKRVRAFARNTTMHGSAAEWGRMLSMYTYNIQNELTKNLAQKKAGYRVLERRARCVCTLFALGSRPNAAYLRPPAEYGLDVRACMRACAVRWWWGFVSFVLVFDGQQRGADQFISA